MPKCETTSYVGVTERTFNERMTEHLKDIEYNREKAVGRHFNMKRHTIDNFTCRIIERIYDDCVYVRKIRELDWMD